MHKTLIINEPESRRLLTMADCIEAMKDTLQAVADKKVQSIQRTMIHHENGNTLAGMAASIETINVTGSKVIIFPGPGAKGTSQGIIPLFDTVSGALLAIVDGRSITHTRTAAASAAATDVMANPDAHVLCLIGAGGQARGHLAAMSEVRKLTEVRVWNWRPEGAARFAEEMGAKYPHLTITAHESAEEAVRGADIICTVTPGRSAEPLLLGEWLSPGCHINAVGACGPAGRELDTEAVRRSRLFVDQLAAAKRDAGDLVIPFNAGELDESHILGEVGDIISGRLPARLSDDDITMFESVGIAAQDIAAAHLIYKRAKAEGAGVEVEI